MAPRLKFLPKSLSRTLMEFQQEGVLFGISKNGRCLIGDEMGLGKTLQALSIAYYYKNEWPLLIVCPSSMRFPWIEEIEKWITDIQPGDVNLVLSGTDASNIQSSKISIVGYGLLSHNTSSLLINCLKDTKFGVVVVDESHYMKNRNASRTKALVSVIKNTRRAILLTGTPALARPEELYVQIDVLKPNLVGSFNKFATRFCEAHMESICGGRVRKWNTRGASNLDELHNILKTNVMIRRLKRNVLTQLPPKRRQRITFDLADSDSKKELTNIITEFRKTQRLVRGRPTAQHHMADKNPVSEMNRLAMLLYKQTGLSKVSAVRQYIADMLENTDKKFLVFAHHLDMMRAVESEVIKKKVKYIRIAGDVAPALRGSLVNKFQNDNTVRVAILSILAASVGITLTAADHIIFTELHWTPGVMEQAEDRVHRIGQSNSVLVQYLVAKGTIDEVLWRMVCNKVYVTTATLNGKTQALDVEEGSEGQSRLLEAFSAWVEEEEEQETSEEEFLFTHSQKKRKQDALQRCLTDFFKAPSSSKCRKTDSGKDWREPPDTSPEEEDEVVEVISSPETLACVQSQTSTESSAKEVQEVNNEVEEENCLRKTTKKTYKVAKKRCAQRNVTEAEHVPRGRPRTTCEGDGNIGGCHCGDGDDVADNCGGSDDMSDCVEMTDSEQIHEYYKMEEEKERDIMNILNNYTKIIDTPVEGKQDEDTSIELDEVMTEGGVSRDEVSLGDQGNQVINVDDGSLLNIYVEERTSLDVTTLQGNDVTESRASKEGKKKNSLDENDVIESCVAIKETGLNGNDVTESHIAKHPTHNDAMSENDLDVNDVTILRATIKENNLDKNDVTKSRVVTKNDALKSEDVDDFKPQDSWCCSLCTFSNNGFLSVCEMCDTPRHKSRRKMTKSVLSTPEFVKRKQQKILKRCREPGKTRKAKNSATKCSQDGGALRHSGSSKQSVVKLGSVNKKRDVSGPKCKTTTTTGDEHAGEPQRFVANDGENVTTEHEDDGTKHEYIITEHQDTMTEQENVTTEYEDDTTKHEDGTIEREYVTTEQQDVTTKHDITTEHENVMTEHEDVPTEHEDCTTQHEDVTRNPVTTDNENITMTKHIASVAEDEKSTNIGPQAPDQRRDTNLPSSNNETSTSLSAGKTSDVIMTSSDETVQGECMGEFDDLADDDWWECQFCHKYNYSDSACETCGEAKNKPSGMLENLETSDDWWRCKDCGEFCFDDDTKECGKCKEKNDKRKKDFQNIWKKFSHLMVDDSEDDQGDVGTLETVENLMFCMSHYTDRVYLYNESAESLQCSVSLFDLESSNTENIPPILSTLSHRKQVLTFLRKWKSLPERKRRAVKKAGMIFDDPYQAAEAIKMGHQQKVCTSRFPSKEKLQTEVLAVAVEKNGTVRQCTKIKESRRKNAPVLNNAAVTQKSVDTKKSAEDANKRTWLQVVDEQGRPLCISCKSVVNTTHTTCEWDERFCSHQCKEHYQVRVSGTRVREILFLEENGVCQQCGLDAHALYRSVKLLAKQERRTYLGNTSFISLPVTLLNKIIIDPKEGMFWEADHVVPVVEGGGECGLDNYRTLCVPCHRHATAELKQRLRTNRRNACIAGVPQITSFFKP